MSDPLFSPDDVREGLEALVDELVERGSTSHIQVVGGAAMMIQANRETLSRDIDALYSPSADIAEAIHSVAVKRNWPETWLNDAVKIFASHFDEPEDWEIHTTRAGVTVSVATCPLLLAMKLLAGRPRDAEDIGLLITACGITTTQAAVDVFDHYFPTEVIKVRSLQILEGLLSCDQ